MYTILKATVGSQAYGLATATSDVDTLGIFAYPTEDFFGLKKLPESIVKNDPDVTMHEAAKFCQLALKCNPSVTELMWLPEELYQEISDEAVHLIAIREAFLSAKYVRNAYLGYATQQFRKLKERGGTFSSDTKKRTAKHARHLLRLLEQGTSLYVDGILNVRVDDPEYFFWVGEQAEKGIIGEPMAALEGAERIFNFEKSILPDEPNTEAVEHWLKTVRYRYLDMNPSY